MSWWLGALSYVGCGFVLMLAFGYINFRWFPDPYGSKEDEIGFLLLCALFWPLTLTIAIFGLPLYALSHIKPQSKRNEEKAEENAKLQRALEQREAEIAQFCLDNKLPFMSSEALRGFSTESMRQG